MKIDGWSIDGFGHFHGFSISDLSPGLTVFMGPNEAGKSTLLAFIRAILFGFPTRNASEPRYEPLRGGRHGGRLFVSTELGRTVIQRYSDKREPFKLWRPDGSEGSEADLQQLLGYADQRLFKAIFAFSLTELQNTKLQKEDGIRDRIFSGSLQGARNSAREALDLIAKQNDPIHKQRARASELILLAERLDGQRQRIREAQSQIRHYEDLIRDEDHLNAEISHLALEQQRLAEQVQRAETLISLWPLWHERKSLLQRLSQLEAVESFPQDALARQASLQAKLEEAEKALAARDLEVADLQQRLEALVIDHRVLERAPEITALQAERSRYQEWKQQRTEDEERRRAASRALELTLASLGETWTRERLTAFEASVIRADEIRGWEERLHQAEQNRLAAERMVQDRRMREQDAKTRLSLHLQQLEALGECPAAETLDAREAALLSLKTTLLEQKETQASLEAQQQRLQLLELERARQALRAARRLPRSLRLALWLGALAVLGMAIWSLLSGALVFAILLAIVSLALGLLPFVRVSAGPDAEKAESDLETTYLEQQAHVARLQERLDTLEARVRRTAESLGFSSVPSSYELEAAIQRLMRERETAELRERARRDAEQLKLLLHEAMAQREEAETEWEALAQAERQLDADWQQRRLELGVEEVTSPQGVMALFQQVTAARQQLQELTTLEARCATLEEKLADYRRQLENVLRALEVPLPPEDSPLEPMVEALFAQVLSEQRAQQRSTEMRELLASEHLKREAQAKEVAALRVELTELYAEAGARDAQEFARREASFRERVQVLQAIDKLSVELDMRLGEGPAADALREELASGDLEAWKAAIALGATRRDELERQRDALNQKLGELQTERRKLEEASDVIAREHEYQALLDEFRRLAREWQVRALAEAMIAETLKDLERTRQPVVLAHASELFRHVTEGRYPRLLQAEGGDFRIEDHRGAQREVSSLSRGTSEQLYLCIRLGLVREFARQSAILPVVMDDVFVNFDPERAQRMAEMLVRFAEDHQVLLFTCHPESAELLMRVQPDVDLRELPRYGQDLPEGEEVRGIVREAEASKVSASE